MKHTAKEWFIATRYWSFAVSAMPVIVTVAYMLSIHLFPAGFKPIICAVLALVGVVVLHAAGNVFSDYFDYRKGVDNPDAFAVPNLVFHKFEPVEYLRFAIILFVIGIAIGLVLFALCGLPVLVIGIVGVALTASYSFLKYHALGDLDIFIIFSVLIMLGTSQVICGSFVFPLLILALPVGLITVSVLHANNTLDIDSDRAAGIKTFAMLLGGKTANILYKAYMVIPFLCIAAAVALGKLSVFALLCFGALPAAIANFKAASHFKEKGIQTMAGLDQGSAKMQTVFSGLLSLGLILAAIFC